MGNLSTKTNGSRDAEIEELTIKLNSLQSSFVGMMSFSPPTAADGSIDPAWVPVSGQTLSRAAYPALWERVKLMGNYVSDAEWLAIQAVSPNGAVSVYSSGDGSTTFRMPTVGEDGGFIRATGTDPVLNALRDLQGGFDCQTEEHKHGTPIVDATSVSGRVGIAANFSDNNYPFGYRTFGDIEDAIYTNVPYNYLNFTVGTEVPEGLISLLTSAATFEHGGETHPKGMFGTLYVYSGNATTVLPEVSPDWLIQQEANTQEIAKLYTQKPFAFGRGGDDVAFSSGQKFYFSEVVSSDVTYNATSRDFMIHTTGYYKVSHECLGVKDANKKRLILTKNKQTAPDRFLSSDYLAQGYCDPTDADHSPLSAQCIVYCEAGDTIQSWAMDGSFYLGLGSSSDYFNQLIIEKV